MSTGIIINNKFYKHEDVLEKGLDSLLQTPFEKKIIAFYRDWFGPAKYFTIKTSGSTGKPKKITFSKKDLIRSAQSSIKALNIYESKNMLVCLNPAYVAGMMMLVRGFVGHLNIHAISPQKNPLEFIHHKIDFTALVPNQLYHIIENQRTKDRLNDIKTVIVGGGNVDSWTLEKLKNIKTNIFHTYGMTETLTHIALRKISGDQEENYKVLEDFGIDTDERNCLTIYTPYQREPLITNDIVEIKNEREFKWIGRIDNVINSGGVKIHPEQIEPIIDHYLKSNTIFAPFFTAGIPDRELENRLVLFMERKHEIDKQKIIKELKALLPEYKSPKDVILLDKFVLTETEKINRRETLNKFFTYGD